MSACAVLGVRVAESDLRKALEPLVPKVRGCEHQHSSKFCPECGEPALKNGLVTVLGAGRTRQVVWEFSEAVYKFASDHGLGALCVDGAWWIGLKVLACEFPRETKPTFVPDNLESNLLRVLAGIGIEMVGQFGLHCLET